jgi:tRNA(fMet)-specific endonuclease VapC
MLDTNMASYIIKGNPPQVRDRLIEVPPQAVVVSAVTKAELLYGVARKGNPAALSRVVDEFLRRAKVLAWDDAAAETYTWLHASCTTQGITLPALDMMIAAHAVAARAFLITHDAAFARIPGDNLAIDDWAALPPR